MRNHKEIKFDKSLNLTKSDITNILTTVPESMLNKFKIKFDLFMSFMAQRKFDGNEIIPVFEQCYDKIIKYNFMDEQDYIDNFNNEFIALMRSHQDFKYLYENQILEIAEIGMKLYSYNYYLHNFCILRILSAVVSQTIMESLIRKQSLEECLNDLKNVLKEYKTGISEIDSMLIQSKEKYQNDLVSFVEEHYLIIQSFYEEVL